LLCGNNARLRGHRRLQTKPDDRGGNCYRPDDKTPLWEVQAEKAASISRTINKIERMGIGA
jgi:hypothetical protein